MLTDVRTVINLLNAFASLVRKMEVTWKKPYFLPFVVMLLWNQQKIENKMCAHSRNKRHSARQKEYRQNIFSKTEIGNSFLELSSNLILITNMSVSVDLKNVAFLFRKTCKFQADPKESFSAILTFTWSEIWFYISLVDDQSKEDWICLWRVSLSFQYSTVFNWGTNRHDSESIIE